MNRRGFLGLFVAAPAAATVGVDPAKGPDQQVEIIIHIDGVDPNNPRHQRIIGYAARQYRERE